MSYYDGIATGYDELYGDEQRKKMAVIWSALLPKEKELILQGKVIDIGAGTGIAAEFLNERGVPETQLVCVDPAQELIALAKKRLPDATCLCVPVEKIMEKMQEGHAVTTCTSAISLTAVQNFSDIELGIKNIRAVADRLWIITVLKKSQHSAYVSKIIATVFDDVDVRKLIDEKDIIYICTTKK